MVADCPRGHELKFLSNHMLHMAGLSLVCLAGKKERELFLKSRDIVS
jgi:hypothetical protein